MRKLLVRIAGSLAVACLAYAPASAQYVYAPPPIAFERAQPLDPAPASPADPFYKPPVRTPVGAIAGNFLRIEVHDGRRPMGIMTLKNVNKTIAVPLEHLRIDTATGEILTDLTWNELVSIPSGPLAG
jgi:hypothetical protein